MFIVRCASGVTRIRQRAVGGSGGRTGVSKATPSARMSWLKTLAEQIVRHLADEAAAPAERGDAGDGVRRRSAARLDPRPHPAVQPFGGVGIDEPHRSLGDPLGGDEGVVGAGDHVDDGIADRDDIEGRGAHAYLLGQISARA